MLYMSTKSLSHAIEKFGKNNAERLQEMHTIACSCVRLAALYGRPDWLNRLHGQLNRLDQDGLRSWFATDNEKPLWGSGQWLRFSVKDGYSVIPGTDALRPTLAHIQMVERDIRLSFAHYSAKRVAAQAGWNKVLISQSQAFLKTAERLAKEQGAPIPRHFILALENIRDMAVTEFSDDKVGVPLPPGSKSDEQIDAEVESDIPAPEVIAAQGEAERKPRRDRRAN